MRGYVVKAWKIWYGDGTTFSSKQGRMADAPRKGVLHVFLEFEPNGIMSGYILTGIEVYPLLEVGDYMMPGVAVSHADYQATMQAAARELNHGSG